MNASTATAIRTAAAIEAIIDGINADAEATGSTVDGGHLNVLSLELKAANAIAKFEKGAALYEAQAAVRDIKVGDAVTFVVGRAATKRIESGSVIFVGDGKTGLQFNVMTGEGLTSKTQLVGADALLLTVDQVEEVQAEIDAAVAAAAAEKAKQDAEAAAKGEGNAE